LRAVREVESLDDLAVVVDGSTADPVSQNSKSVLPSSVSAEHAGAKSRKLP